MLLGWGWYLSCKATAVGGGIVGVGGVGIVVFLPGLLLFVLFLLSLSLPITTTLLTASTTLSMKRVFFFGNGKENGSVISAVA